jgi:hypothetical protein
MQWPTDKGQAMQWPNDKGQTMQWRNEKNSRHSEKHYSSSFIFDDFHFFHSRVIGLDMTENRIFNLCRMIT